MALSRAGARGQTALFDAIDKALEHLDGGTQQRKVLIVVSDGGDNASRATFERRPRPRAAPGRGDLHHRSRGSGRGRGQAEGAAELAAVTGGEAFFPHKNEEITPVLERIARDIRSSYTLGYVPDGDRTAEVRRRIQVDVHAPDRRGLHARARSLYLQAGPQR